MQTVATSEVFVFDAVGLVVVRTGMATSARAAREVTLHGNGRHLDATAVGAGCHRGHVTILLRPRGDFHRALESLAYMLEADRIELHTGGEPLFADAGRSGDPSTTTMKSFVLDALG